MATHLRRWHGWQAARGKGVRRAIQKHFKHCSERGAHSSLIDFLESASFHLRQVESGVRPGRSTAPHPT